MANVDDPRTPSARTLDDEALAVLVRDATSAWSPPPQRIGRATWRERVERRSSRRIAAGGWRGRWAAASITAVTATVALALVAVWLTAPPTSPGIGASSAPSVSGVAGRPTGSSGAAAASPSVASPASSASSSLVPGSPSVPLPTATVFAPVADRQIFVVGGNGFTTLDLETGRLGTLAFYRTAGSAVFRRPDGSYACACFTQGRTTDAAGAIVDTITLQLRRVAPDGSVTGYPVPGASWQATRPASVGTEQWVVSAGATYDATTDRVYVGWSSLDGHTWRRGIAVVDLDAPRIVASIPLPATPDSDHALQVFAWQPQLRFPPDGRHLMAILTRAVGTAGVSRTDRQIYSVGSSGIPEAEVGALNAVTSACEGTAEGWASATRYYVICASEGTITTYGAGGTSLGTATMPQAVDLGGVATATVVDDSGRLFAWNPGTRRMTVVDTDSGQIVYTGAAPAVAFAQPDPLAGLARQFGNWLAPAAAAKVFLSPALLLSPDGSRLYALGVTGSNEHSGSAGIDVFDTRTLVFVDHWAPNADWFSMRLSGDGSQLYVSGIAGADASGAGRGDQSGSVTVLDARTGGVQAVFGQLGDTVDLDVTAANP